MSKLIIYREKSAAFSARLVKVFIDDVEMISMTPGYTYEHTVCAGSHTVELKLGSKTIGIVQVNTDDATDTKIRYILSAGTGAAQFDVIQMTKASAANPYVAPPVSYTTHSNVANTRASNSGCLWTMIAIIVIATILWIILPAIQVTFRISLSPG